MLTLQMVAEIYLKEIGDAHGMTNLKLGVIDDPEVLRGGTYRYTVHFTCDQHPDGDTFTIDQDGPPVRTH